MKRRRIFAIAGLILLAAVLGGLYQRYFSSPLGRLVLDLYFQGIIVDTAKHPDGLSFTGVWEVTPDEIRQMESKLTTYVRRHRKRMGGRISNELRYYKRQYLGVLGEDSEKLIDISFCHEKVTDRRDWLQYYSEEVGGGDYYWHIIYDVDLGNFRNFFANEPD